jgi:hypothetical protein
LRLAKQRDDTHAASVLARARSLDSGLRRNDGEGHRQRSKNEAAQPRWSEPSAASCDTPALPSVNGDGAMWPKVEQEEPRLFQTTSSAKVCRVGGLHRPFLLATSLWASKEK